MTVLAHNVLTVNLVFSTLIFWLIARIYLVPKLQSLEPRDILVPILLCTRRGTSASCSWRLEQRTPASLRASRIRQHWATSQQHFLPCWHCQRFFEERERRACSFGFSIWRDPSTWSQQSRWRPSTMLRRSWEPHIGFQRSGCLPYW